MSRGDRRGEVRIRVVGVLREEPDLRLLARALIGLARSEAAAGVKGKAKDATPPRNGSTVSAPVPKPDRAERDAA